MASASAGAFLCLKLDVSEIADEGKEDCGGQSRIDGRLWEPRQMKGLALKKAAVTERSVDCGRRHEKRGEGVEAKSFKNIAMQKRREGSGGPATGALDMKVLIDGALRVKGVQRGRETQEHGRYKSDGSQRRGSADGAYTPAASMDGHRAWLR